MFSESYGYIPPNNSDGKYMNKFFSLSVSSQFSDLTSCSILMLANSLPSVSMGNSTLLITPGSLLLIQEVQCSSEVVENTVKQHFPYHCLFFSYF